MKLKKLFLIVFSAVILFTFTSCDEEEVNPTLSGYVNDYAVIMQDKDTEEITAEGEALFNKTKAQVVICTLKTLNGKDIAEYTTRLAEKWELGDSEKDNGVLILLTSSDREVQIAVGSGLEGALNDAKCGRIIDAYGMEYFNDDRFSTGLKNIYHAVVSEIYIEEGLTPENYDSKKAEEQPATAEDVVGFAVAAAIIIAVAIIIFFANRNNRGGGNPPFIFFGRAFWPFGRNGNDDDNNHFGGFGGGGFGGGGGFSGGGGGFSGGGAGRGF